ncbi:PREDICTED: ER membrane protein complex subunit 2-like [Priapulus caudatus]|uniref:ER membrane protein complex subunit 2 n=1 Tax=Priapulus caudatus TaxID=37621 RepID=A0ABM1EZ69_PRICU|nr:PREDICTED: ER membrane protein complex subunit 2-like [Priapulus caudatus]
MLRKFRDDNDRRSEEVVEIYEECLTSKMNKLGNEKWLVYEQVCLAALDCSRQDIAQKCLSALRHQFPDSSRVKKLAAMQHESLGSYERAIRIYDSLQHQDESSSSVRKRRISILHAAGKTSDAIVELNAYLKQFMSDYEAWMELCDLYISENDYAKASYCMEEVLLSNPHNHLYHQRYADIRYTQGTIDNMELARAHYSQAVALNCNNVRAMYGLFLSASNIASAPKSTVQRKRDNIKYAMWAANQIHERYQKLNKENDTQMKAVDDMLESLQFATVN